MLSKEPLLSLMCLPPACWSAKADVCRANGKQSLQLKLEDQAFYKALPRVNTGDSLPVPVS